MPLRERLKMETPPRFATRSAYVAQDEALLPRLRGLPWLTPFLVSLSLCAGLALTPARTVAIGVDDATSAEQGHDHDDHELPLRIFRLVSVR